MDDLMQKPVPELVAMGQKGSAGAEQELMRRLADDPDNAAVAAALKELGVEPDGTSSGAQGAAGGSTGVSAQGEQTWLVQRALESGGWMDVGDVVVAPRTKRRTIVEKALEVYPDHAPPKDHEAVVFRVLDADSAAGILVRWEVPPAPAAVLRIG